MQRKQIGVIGVDAGLCWVGDPCYILHKPKKEQPKAIGKTWREFCDKLTDKDVMQFDYDRGHAGLGVCVSTGYGDGCYPVYAEFEDGRVARITVDFMPDEDDNL